MSMPACLAAIVLLLDVSGSVDNTHYAAQRDGTAAAFEHPHVIGTIAASEGVAVALAEFAYRATTRLGWVMICGSITVRTHRLTAKPTIRS